VSAADAASELTANMSVVARRKQVRLDMNRFARCFGMAASCPSIAATCWNLCGSAKMS
jgi:hypothetical protein